MSTPAAPNGAVTSPGLHPGLVVGAIAVFVLGAFVATPSQSQPASPAPTSDSLPRPGPSTPSYLPPAPPLDRINPAPLADPVTSPRPRACRDCGVISSVTPVEQRGEGNAAGAILGGIVGGVIGHQVGGGRGRDAATVAGAVGGALVGNELSRGNASVSHWEVRVRFDDGTNQMIRFDQEPSWRVGDKVRVDGGRIVADR